MASSYSSLSWLSLCLKGIVADAVGSLMPTQVTHSHVGKRKRKPDLFYINPGQAGRLTQPSPSPAFTLGNPPH